MKRTAQRRADPYRDTQVIDERAPRVNQAVVGIVALIAVVTQGRIGEVYNIGGSQERRNIDVVRGICELMDDMLPQSGFRPHADLIQFVSDRPGHDARYAIDCSKIRTELGWQPQENFESGLEKTVRWYLDNKGWWERVLSGAYRTERLGLKVTA